MAGAGAEVGEDGADQLDGAAVVQGRRGQTQQAGTGAVAAALGGFREAVLGHRSEVPVDGGFGQPGAARDVPQPVRTAWEDEGFQHLHRLVDRAFHEFLVHRPGVDRFHHVA